MIAVTAVVQGPLYKRFRSSSGEHVFAVSGSRIYDLDHGVPAGGHSSDDMLDGLLRAFVEADELHHPTGTALSAVVAPAPQSLSLNVSASCNLSCAYCYAARGGFGGAQAGAMTWETAKSAIDRLLTGAQPDVPITIGFLGGEPFINRGLIHQAVAYASSLAHERSLDVRYSVTTNGTLLRNDDLQLLRDHPFAVTVSIDGAPSLHDRLRPLQQTSASSFARMREAIEPLLGNPGYARLSARTTVSRFNMNLMANFDAITRLGFAEVGFAPLKSGPTESGVLRDEDWDVYLRKLIALAEREMQAALRGAPIRLTNFAIALKQLHRGACSPYPCGAGGGYFSVAVNGDWYTCHRAIGNEQFFAGTSNGLDQDKRIEFLRARHVHAQSDCQACWARYLCSGSCHQEASARSAASCDFIRGWLEYCLSAYCDLSAARPSFFNAPMIQEEVAP